MRDGNALAVASRQPTDLGGAHRSQPQTFRRGVHRGTEARARQSLESAHEDQELSDTHAEIERRVFRHITDAPTRGRRIGHDVETRDARGARGRSEVPGEDAEDRRLAGAIRPEQTHDLPGTDCEGDVVHGEARPIPLGQLFGNDDRAHQAIVSRCHRDG